MELQKRAERFMDDLPGYDEKNQTLIMNIFKAHIMEQDRDTRHACAEAVEATALPGAPEICRTQNACSACVNTQAL